MPNCSGASAWIISRPSAKPGDGRLIDVSVTISPVRDKDGTIIGASKIARDITFQKHVQRELEEARRIAVEANAAKDHFLSVLSHELRTPLTPVLAAVSFIESGTELPDEVREQIEMIRRNVETEARLVDDLLDLTRISRGKIQLHFEVTDLHTAARNAISMFQKQIDEKGLAVTLALRAKEFHVWADPGRLQQVFLNLISNAVKFTPQGGTITVKSYNEGSELRVEIADTGVGIAPDFLPRLFNAFEQGEQSLSRRFGGLGLGLSIVKSLVEMHKGTITAASDGPGAGATFSLQFASVPAESKAPRVVRPGPPEPVAAFRILLVEDHDDTRVVMTRLLKSFGFTVATATSVREAMELAAHEKFDLLVSDIGLPDGSGIDIMTHLKAHQKIKGIALSGFGQDDDVRRSTAAGFEQHLTKPVNFTTLKETIAKLRKE